MKKDPETRAQAPKAGSDLFTALASEGAEFVAQSWTDWCDTQAAALSSTTPFEAMQAQTDYTLTVMARYAQSATRCATLISEAAGTAPLFSTGPQERGYDDVPL